MNPVATMYMKNGTKIVMELLPDAAPNTVNSFIYAAQKKVFDNHKIQRIVPQNWLDMSYTGFNTKEGQYLTPYEAQIHPEIEPLDSSFGCVCMGGYGKMGQSGCEFFFPMRACPEHKGIYPVFGKVLEGHEELLRIRDVETIPITTFPIPGVEVNEPVHPEIIEKVEIQLNGYEPEVPVMLEMKELPAPWKQYWDMQKNI